jgi:hypothetical protein
MSMLHDGTGPRPVSRSDRAVLPGLDELLALADGRAGAYASAQPFPHTIIDGLLDDEQLHRVAAEMPPRSAQGWTKWETLNEWKYVFDQPEHFGPAARRLHDALNSSEFVRFLERLTGIGGLVPDPHLTAAGYFDIEPGGFLNVHVDFTRNPRLNLDRRVNVLVYLNPNWEASWGGQLELWRSLDEGPVTEIVPLMGRMVVFSTPGAAHGHPKPVAAPDGRSRLCFSAYYFTSPDAPDGPADFHGVLFRSRSRRTSRALRAVRSLCPPILIDGVKLAIRQVRRRSVQRAG